MNIIKLNSTQFRIFENIFKAINELINVTRVSFDEDKLTIQSMDTTNVAMCILEIRKEFFNEGVKLEKDSLGLILNIFNQFLKRYKLNEWEVITINFEDMVTIKNDYKEFSTRTREVFEEDKPIPTLEDGIIIKLDTSFFNDMLADVESSGGDKAICFKVKDKAFIVSNKNTDMNSCVEIENKQIEIVKGFEGENESSYSLDYLKKMILKGEEKVEFNFKKDYPLRIKYEGEHWKLAYILAPRIAND